MAWWRRFVQQEKAVERVVRQQPVDIQPITQVHGSSVRQLNEQDKAVIKRIQNELLSAGVLGDRSEEIVISDRIEDILRIAEEQGLRNVKELIGDEELDNRIAEGIGSSNLMLNDFDEYEDVVYDVYEDETALPIPQISVRAEGENGGVELRLPDGTTIYGQIPG